MSPSPWPKPWRTRTTLETTIGGKSFRGIVHGDIKPKNIRIDAHGEVRVLDFGIAKALSLSRRLTRNEFGSVPYASPERLDSGDVECAIRSVVAGRHALRNGHRHDSPTTPKAPSGWSA